MANVGATDHGAQHVRGHPGAWGQRRAAGGRSGADERLADSVFVLTHHECLGPKGETTFAFVTDGIAPALEQGAPGAGARDVAVVAVRRASGSTWWLGLLDELALNLVRILLGQGERLLMAVSSAGRVDAGPHQAPGPRT